MNARQRNQYWLNNARMMRRIELKYKPRVHSVIKKIVDKFIENRANIDFMDADFMNIYKQLYTETVIRFGNEQFRRLRREKQFGFNAEWTAFVNEYLATQGFTLVTSVTGNLRNVILKIISQPTQESIEQGLGVAETTALIMERLQEFKESTLSEYMAERIVRTETTRAANIGHMEGAKKSPFVVTKMWIAARDERTRRQPRDVFSHVALDGQTRELEEPFMQIGTNGQQAIAQQPGDASQPGDPSALAAFTINCRCTIAFVPKRDVNGRLIRKITR